GDDAGEIGVDSTIHEAIPRLLDPTLFIGREHELRRLQLAFDAAAACCSWQVSLASGRPHCAVSCRYGPPHGAASRSSGSATTAGSCPCPISHSSRRCGPPRSLGTWRTHPTCRAKVVTASDLGASRSRRVVDPASSRPTA